MNAEYNYAALKQCGVDVFISANVEIRRPHLVSIGSHVAVDTGFYCTVGVELGDYIHIGPYVTIIGGSEGLLRMDHFSSIAAGSRIICGSDEHLGYGLPGPTIPPQYHDKLIIKPITFEMFANVATNVIIFPGVTLAQGCVIGAGSIVTKNTEPWTVYTGIPALPRKKRLKDKMIQYAREMGYTVEEK